MGPFASGLGLVILVFMLLFTWLAVATFASPELAAVMGLGLIGVWFFLFVPIGLVRELLWQNRQRKIISSALTHAPVPYQPGMALPPPSHLAGSGAVGGGSSGSLVTLDQPGSGGALDVYRELPQLPMLEPRPHGSQFKRSLILPFAGLMMFIGANNDTVIHKLLEARGMAERLPVEWANVRLPSDYSGYQQELDAALRLTLRREPSCGRILAARISGARQFTGSADQAKQIDDEAYVYEFDCAGDGRKASAFLAWVTPEELGRNSFTTLFRMATSRPDEQTAQEACTQAAQKTMESMGGRITPTLSGPLLQARMPYPEFVRLSTTYSLTRLDGATGTIQGSCWLGQHTPAQVRFRKDG